MASSIINDDDFMTELTTPFIYYKTRPFLKFYLTKGFRFMSHQKTSSVKKWYKAVDEATTVQEMERVCNEMYDVMFNTAEHRVLFENIFNEGIRTLFGGMFGMNRDYWAEMGIGHKEAFDYYYFSSIPPLQRFQLLMCWEMFWGLYGNQNKARMANYVHMHDDLYTTISMSEFTPYYLGAIKHCTEEKPGMFVATVVNIIMHAFNHIKTTRKAKYMSKDDTLNVPLWREWYSKKMDDEPLYFKRSVNEMMLYTYNEEKMETLIPACLKDLI